MAQQEAPEVGAVIDGYRFKGGDPKQEASWEQTEPLPAPEYGQGAMRLPNGAVVRYGPRGGMDTIVSAAQAAAAGNGTESAPLVGADARARFMINLGPLQAAQDNLERMDREGYNPSSFQNAGAAALEAVPFDAGFAARIAGGEDYNAYNQAAKTFEAAILPIMSGAAVTPTEAQRLIRAALPQPGDSPEVLAQKSEQRRMMINAVAQGIGQAAPYDPNDPGNLRIRDLLPDETPEALAASGRVRGADGVWRYPRDDQGNPIFPEDGGTPPADDGGVDGSARPGSAGEAAPAVGAIEARTADQGIGRRADTFVRGIADAATFGLSDEITAGLNTIAPLDRGTRGGWNGDWGGAYRQNLDLMRGIDEADAEQMPLTRGAGQLVGAVGGGVGTARMAPQFMRLAPRVAGAGRAANAGRIAANTGRLAAGGGAAGAAYGFGSSEGDLGERADDAIQGGVLGAVAAPVVGAAARPVINNVLAPVGRSIARPIAALGERFGVPGAAEASRRLAPNVLEGAVDRYGARFNPDAGVLAQQADERAAQGLETTFVDLMDEGQRGLGRALATRQTPARQAVREFAEGRAENLPDRMATQARRHISPDPRSPRQMREDFSEQGREAAGPLYDAAYARPGAPRSPLTDVLLERPSMQSALTRAVRIAREEGRDPNTLGFDFNEAGDVVHVREPSMQTMDYVKRGLDDHLESFRDPVTGRLNADEAVRAAQRTRVQFRNELRRLNPVYGEALDAYSDQAALREGADIGEDFLTQEADDFAAAVSRLSPQQREVARAAARRAVERGAGTQGAAPGVAQRLASGREQNMRNAALLENPIPMQDAMRAEREGVMAARAVNPGAGSPTAPALSDQAQAGLNAASAVGNAMTGNLRGSVGALGRLVRLGYSDREAEALMTAAIDPNRTREVIDMLATRMNRQDARSMLRAIRFSAARGAGEYAGDEE